MPSTVGQLALLALTLTACRTEPLGNGDDDGGLPPVDAASDRDGGQASADLATASPPDFAAFDLAGPRPTGSPCAMGTACASGFAAGSCLTTDGQGVSWTDGYCTSGCRPSNTNPQTGGNSDCPGQGVTCWDFGTGKGACVARCADSSSCRSAYACFVVNGASLGCLPRAYSQCDPRVAKSCASQMMLGRTCYNIGDGTVGACYPACNPFGNPTGCNPMDPYYSTCHVSEQTGEGLCASPAPTMSGCNVQWDCPSGRGCFNGRCVHYCDDANAAQQCPQGATCKPLPFSSLTTKTIGVCSQ